ncbi:MAG: DUF4199 domain-containing protein [Sphingobacteriales bacterium]|nr:DUF4199 domain-containing protein [Sphingobacteriales bacterium]
MENLNKNAINNGIILAVISIAAQLIVYYAFPSIIGSLTYSLSLTLISLLIYIVFTIDLKKKIGGYWSFKDALKGIFLMSLLGNLITNLSMFVFFKFIESDAYDKVSQIVTQNAISNLERFGVTDQNQVDQAVDQALKQIKSIYQPDFKSFLISIGTTILIGFVMSLIFAAIFKKNPPMFAPTEESES